MDLGINMMNRNSILVIEKLIVYGFLLPVLVVLVGFKDPLIWRDYTVYLEYYNKAYSYSFYEILFNVQDPFFTIFNKFLINFGFSFENVILIIAIITLYLKFYAFRKISINFFLFVIIYSSLTLGLQDYMQIRVAFALIFTTFALYVVKGTFFKIIFSILSILFHFSTIIVLIPYFYFIFFKNKYFPFIVYILSLSLTFLLSTKILEGWSRFAQYLESHQYYNPYASIPMLQVFILLYLVFKYKEKSICLEYYISITGIMAYYLLWLTPAAATRYMEITTIFFIILLLKFFKDNFIKTGCLILFVLGLFNLFMKPASFLYSYYLEFLNII